MKLSEVTNPDPNLNYPGVLLGADAAHVSIMRYDLLNQVRSREAQVHDQLILNRPTLVADRFQLRSRRPSFERATLQYLRRLHAS